MNQIDDIIATCEDVFEGNLFLEDSVIYEIYCKALELKAEIEEDGR